jgi:hypothetical protein
MMRLKLDFNRKWKLIDLKYAKKLHFVLAWGTPDQAILCSADSIVKPSYIR